MEDVVEHWPVNEYPPEVLDEVAEVDTEEAEWMRLWPKQLIEYLETRGAE